MNAESKKSAQSVNGSVTILIHQSKQRTNPFEVHRSRVARTDAKKQKMAEAVAARAEERESVLARARARAKEIRARVDGGRGA